MGDKQCHQPCPSAAERLHRRHWLEVCLAACGATGSGLSGLADEGESAFDLVILGASLGGCAAALAALRGGLRVAMTEETDWIGGQLTSQAVPPDEHRWIEQRGATATYRELRNRIRAFYRQHFPLTDRARESEYLNPGAGSVSRLCHEPRVALAVLQNWLLPYLGAGRLTLLTRCVPTAAEVDRDFVQAIKVTSLRTRRSRWLRARLFADATELGDVLPLCQTEYVVGAEARNETQELHAAEEADVANQQAFTVCFPISYHAGQDHTIERPAEYDFWSRFVPDLTPAWPGRLLDWTYTHPRSGEPRKLGFNPTEGPHGGVINLWLYRRIASRGNFRNGHYLADISLVNWPQNDYLLGNLIDVSEQERARNIERGKQLSLSLLYWMQTQAPRPDDGQGFPGLKLRPDVVGTADGMAKYPYIRESRRILAEFTVREEHVGRANRAQITGQSQKDVKAAVFADSVGVGYYPIDLHPSSGGDNYIDFPALPFQIPLGALIPRRVENLLAACKNLGVTHITGGCYRLHPVEWGIGEAVGLVARFCNERKILPRTVLRQELQLADFQKFIRQEGVETEWGDT